MTYYLPNTLFLPLLKYGFKQYLRHGPLVHRFCQSLSMIYFRRDLFVTNTPAIRYAFSLTTLMIFPADSGFLLITVILGRKQLSSFRTNHPNAKNKKQKKNGYGPSSLSPWAHSITGFTGDFYPAGSYYCFRGVSEGGRNQGGMGVHGNSLYPGTVWVFLQSLSDSCWYLRGIIDPNRKEPKELWEKFVLSKYFVQHFSFCSVYSSFFLSLFNPVVWPTNSCLSLIME